MGDEENLIGYCQDANPLASGTPVYLSEEAGQTVLTTTPPLGVSGDSSNPLMVTGPTQALPDVSDPNNCIINTPYVYDNNTTLEWRNPSYLNNGRMYLTADEFRLALKEQQEQLAKLSEYLSEVENQLDDVDDNKAKMLMLAKRGQRTIDNDDTLWHIKDYGIPRLNNLLNINFHTSEEDVEDFLIKYAMKKMDELKTGE